MADSGPRGRPTTRAQAGAASVAELLELAPIAAIVRVFGTDEIVYWSHGAEELYGWPADEAVGQVTHTLLQTRFRTSKEAVDDELRTRGHWSGELVHLRRDGEHVVVASRQVVQRDEQGQPLATLELNTDITYRRRLEENVRASEERFRLLVTNVQDYAIFMLSPHGEVLTWNEGAQRLKGYTPEEIIGKSFACFYTPEASAAGLPQLLLERAAREGRVEHEGWRVRKDGSRFWADVVITALRDSDGTLQGFAKITRDLTERRQAEQARARASREEGARAVAEAAAREIRASRDQLAAILAGVAEGITAIAPSGRMLFANEEAARLCGFSTTQELLAASREEIFSRFEVMDESGAPFPLERLPTQLALAGLPTAEALLQFRVRATGEEHWSLLNATAIKDETGAVAMAVSIFRDVTDRYLAQEASRFVAAVNLELSRSLDYTDTLQRVAELSVGTFADWCMVDVLEHGQARRVAVAHSTRAAADADALPDPEQLTRREQRVLLTDVSDAELQSLGRDPHHVASLRSLQIRSLLSVPLVGHGERLGSVTFLTTESGRRLGQHQLAIAEDLAARAALALDNSRLYREAQQQAEVHVKLNAALRDTMLQLQQALETRDEFLASVSHDLKNPIASIKGMAQLLERRLTRFGGVPTEQLIQTLTRIDGVASRAAAQVDELLDVARMRLDRPLDLDRDAIDLVDLTRTIVAEHQHGNERNSIHFDSTDPSLIGQWDARRLSRALANVLDNAVKYSPDGTDVQVRVVRDDGSALISVEDHGVGIPPQDIESIFERFYRGSNVTGRIAGTGIGLASAQHIVQSHGGTIAADSEPGRGTTIHIRLPLQPVEQ